MKSSAILDRIRVLLKDTPPFDQLSEQERENLLGDISIEYYEPEDVIVEQGSRMHRGLYLVESGLVRLMDVDQQRLIDKCGEGDLFGSFGLLKGGGTIYEAKAVEPSVCAMLKAERFQRLIEQHEEVAAFFESDITWYLRRQGLDIDVTGTYLLFSRRLEQLAHRPPVTASPDITAQEAARRMSQNSVGSLLVMNNGQMAGLLTDSDVRARLVARGRSLDTPVREIMSAPVVTVSVRSSLFEAMMVMLAQRVRHLVITSEENGQETPVAILTHQDLAHFRGLDPVATVTRIERVATLSDLTDIRTEMNEHVLHLYQQGVPPEQLHRLLGVIYDRIARRVLYLVEQAMKAATGTDHVEWPWVWMRLGSSGRQEMALNSTQHNAILYADPASEEESNRADVWFDTLAEQANSALEACGFTMSEIIARDPRWRMPLRQWKQTYRTWIFEADEAALASAPIFFDMRAIYGDFSLMDELKQDLEDALNVQMLDRERKFLPLMAERALDNRPPLSFFQRFVLERSGEQRRRFDIRERGILPVVDAARILAMETRYVASMNTFDRLRYATEALPELSETLDAVLKAYQYLLDYRLEHQLSCIEAGEPPDDFIDPVLLTKIQRNLLRSSFAAVATLQRELAKRYDVSRSLFSRRTRSSE